MREAVDAHPGGGLPIVTPGSVFLGKREVFASVSPAFTDQLDCCALVGTCNYSSQLGRLRKNGISREHEARPFGWDVWRWRRAGVLIAVKKYLVRHLLFLSTSGPAPRNNVNRCF